MIYQLLLLLAWTLLCLPKGFSRTLFCLRTTQRRWMKLNSSPGIYFKSLRQHFVATGTCLIVPEGDKEGSWSKLDVHLVSCNTHWKVETWETSQILFQGNLQNMWQQGLDLTVLRSTLRLVWPSEASHFHWFMCLWVLLCYNFQCNPAVYLVLTPWLLYLGFCHYKEWCLWVLLLTERLLNVWSIVKLLRKELPFSQDVPCNVIILYFLLAHIPSCGIIPLFTRRKLKQLFVKTHRRDWCQSNAYNLGWLVTQIDRCCLSSQKSDWKLCSACCQNGTACLSWHCLWQGELG